MTHAFCSNSNERKNWAIGLCFAAAILTSLEALHPGSCAWLGLNDEQSFSLSASFAAVNAFFASFILAQLVRARKDTSDETTGLAA